MPPYAGTYRFIRGFPVGIAGLDPDLWDFCGAEQAAACVVAVQPTPGAPADRRHTVWQHQAGTRPGCRRVAAGTSHRATAQDQRAGLFTAPTLDVLLPGSMLPVPGALALRLLRAPRGITNTGASTRVIISRGGMTGRQTGRPGTQLLARPDGLTAGLRAGRGGQCTPLVIVYCPREQQRNRFREAPSL